MIEHKADDEVQHSIEDDHGGADADADVVGALGRVPKLAPARATALGFEPRQVQQHVRHRRR